jgi:Fanconi anemia group M protein
MAIDFGLSVLWARSGAEAANLLFAMARKEQLENKSMPRIRGDKKPVPISEQQLYIVAGLPTVEKATAKKLLEHFGSPERIFGASEGELQDVKGIGEVKAKRIREVLTRPFEVEP